MATHVWRSFLLDNTPCNLLSGTNVSQYDSHYLQTSTHNLKQQLHFTKFRCKRVIVSTTEEVLQYTCMSNNQISIQRHCCGSIWEEGGLEV
jgi:hypothetical protein